MFNTINCYFNGKRAERVFQWDSEIYLTVEGLSEFTSAPAFHFCTGADKEAYVVETTINECGITGKIPNILLQQTEPIIVYIYQDNDKSEGGRTTHMLSIPIIARAKPLDYEFNETVDYIGVVEITEELKALKARVDNLSAGGSGDGKDGFSPIVEVASISGGNRVVITDKFGTHQFDVMNGKDGNSGDVPTPTIKDNGKFLRVNNGKPEWQIIPRAEGNAF